MCTGRLRNRCPSSNPEFNAKLTYHKFNFHKKSTDGSAKADAEYTGNSEDIVWGVVFSIDKSEETDLDNAEGLGHGYDKSEVDVIDVDGNTHKAKIYIAIENAINRTLQPYSWYKRFVINGAKQHNLPEEYVNKLNRFDAIEDPDRKRDVEKREIKC